MRNGATKLTTDKFDAIDIRDFQRRGYLGPGCEFTISLNRNGAPHSILDGYTEKKDVVFPKVLRPTVTLECKSSCWRGHLATTAEVGLNLSVRLALCDESRFFTASTASLGAGAARS